jgi:hypothetical protein
MARLRLVVVRVSNLFGLACLALALWIASMPIPKAEKQPTPERNYYPPTMAESMGCTEVYRVCKARQRMEKIK